MELEERKLFLDLIGSGIATHRAFSAITSSLAQVATSHPDPKVRAIVFEDVKKAQAAATEMTVKLESALSLLSAEGDK